MLIAIIVLLIILLILFAQFGSNYYSRVKVIRRFFKDKSSAPEKYLERSSVIRDINYLSVFSCGTLDLYTSNEADENQPVLIWVHGGGYVGGDKSCAKPWAHVIASELKMAVASINYCLSPEQHYPSPILQLSEAIDFLTQNRDRFRLDTSRIFLAGDSAGAQITSQFASVVCSEKLRQSMNIIPPLTREQLKGILLCCGFYNMDTVDKSGFPAIKTFLWAYTNERNIDKFSRKDEMSAVKHISKDFCPVFITCGDVDPFFGQANEFFDALVGADAEVEAYFPKSKNTRLGHEYQFRIGAVKEADIALSKAVDFIEKRL